MKFIGEAQLSIMMMLELNFDRYIKSGLLAITGYL